MDLGLKNRVALITGASRGLGYATARELLLDGARVVINSRSADKLEKAAETLKKETGGDVFPLTADMADPNAADILVKKTVEHFGQLDLLFTNSGGPPAGSFETFDDAACGESVQPGDAVACALDPLRSAGIAQIGCRLGVDSDITLHQTADHQPDPVQLTEVGDHRSNKEPCTGIGP